jgi:hypothetical protein
MIQRGQHLRFALEARHACGIAGEGLGQDLQGYVAVQFGIPSAIDFSHPTRAECADDLIRTDFCSGA